MLPSIIIKQERMKEFYQFATEVYSLYSQYFDKKYLLQLEKAQINKNQHHQVLGCCFEAVLVLYLIYHQEKGLIRLYTYDEKIQELTYLKDEEGNRPDFLVEVLSTKEKICIEAKIIAVDKTLTEPLEIFQRWLKSNLLNGFLTNILPQFTQAHKHDIFGLHWLKTRLPKTKYSLLKQLERLGRAAYKLKFGDYCLEEYEVTVLNKLLDLLPPIPAVTHPQINRGVDGLKKSLIAKLPSGSFAKKLKERKIGYIVALSSVVFFDSLYCHLVQSYQVEFENIFVNNPSLSGVILSFTPNLFLTEYRTNKDLWKNAQCPNDFRYIANPFAEQKISVNDFCFAKTEE